MDGLVCALQGRLGQDAELRYTAQGKPMAQFSVAVEDARAPEGTPAQWVRIALFGERAEDLVEKLTKGCEVYSEGKLTLRTWEAADGVTRSGLSLLAWTVQPIGQIGRRGAATGLAAAVLRRR